MPNSKRHSPFHPDFDVEISRGVYLFLLEKMAHHIRQYLDAAAWPRLTVLGIAEGGKIIAHDLAQRVDLPAAFYFPKAVNNAGKLQACLSGTDILLVDEIVDSGATMRDTVSRLTDQGMNVKYTASLFLRSTSVFIPNYSVYTITHAGWFRFWWEPEWYGSSDSKGESQNG